MIAEFVPLLIASVFAVIIAVFALLMLISRKIHPTKKDQRKTFACGEEIEEKNLNIPAESLYNNMIKTLRLDVIRRWHSGNLASYIITIMLGMVLMIIYFIYVW